MAVSDWSSTADDNTEINGISIAEHCPAKNMNDALRAVMASLKNKCDALDDTDNTLRRGAVIGEVRWFAMSTPPDGWLVCNGAAVGTSDYAALFAAIGNTFLPEDTSVSPATFNLPNLMGKVPWGSSSQVGTEMKAGVPNINGNISAQMPGGIPPWMGQGYGALFNNYVGKNYPPYPASAGTVLRSNSDILRFDASHSNPIYGRSDTVQPPALCLLPCIRYE